MRSFLQISKLIFNAFMQTRCVYIFHLHLVLEYVTNLLTCMMLEPSTLAAHDRGTLCLMQTWAARCNAWLLIKLTPTGVVFSSFLFFLLDAALPT